MTAHSEGSGWVKRQQAIIKAAIAMGIKRGPMALLRVLLAAEDGRKQTVLVSRETLASMMGAAINTVDANMCSLVSAGAVTKLYSRGGKGKANIYKITINPNYIPENRVGSETEAPNLPNFRSIPTQFSVHTYPETGEPSSLSSLSRREGGASRAGRANPPLDAGASASRGGASPETVAQIAENMLFSREMDAYGYGEARARQKARQAASGAGL